MRHPDTSSALAHASRSARARHRRLRDLDVIQNPQNVRLVHQRDVAAASQHQIRRLTDPEPAPIGQVNLKGPKRLFVPQLAQLVNDHEGIISARRRPVNPT